MFAAALAVLCLVRVLEDPSLGRMTGYAAALALAALSHPLSALLVVSGHCVAAALHQARLGATSWRATRSWLAAAVPGALPAVALLALGYRDRAQISWIGLLTLDGFQAVPERLFLSGAVGGAVLVLAVVAVRRDTDRECLAAAAFAPLVGLLVAGTLVHVWVARYALVVLPPMAALAAADAVRFGRARAVATVAVLAVLGWPAQVDARAPAGHSEDSTKILTVIGPRYRPGDVAVFPDTHPSIPWAPRDIYERYLPVPRPPDVLRTAPQRTNGRFLATECPGASCLGDPPRIWVIRVDNATDPLRDMSPASR